MFQRVVQWVNGFGYGKIMLKSDQEQFISDLLEGLKVERQGAMEEATRHINSIRGFEDVVDKMEIVFVNSPVWESHSKWAVEIAIR